MFPPELVDIILIVLMGICIGEGIWLALLARRMKEYVLGRESQIPKAANIPAETERSASIEDIFLLHRSGLLLKHYTKRMRPNVDSDVLSGMLVAVQEFMKDSFRGESGALSEIRFGDLRIEVLEGKWTIIACVVRGEKILDIQPQIAEAVREVEEKYGDLLMNWDGTLDAAPEVDVIMRRLISGGYTGAGRPKSPQPAIILER